MKLSSTVLAGFAIVFMLLFLGALGLRIWASGEAARITGPDHIAAGNDRIYFHRQGEIFELAGSGELIGRQPIGRFGLDDSPIDLRVLSDGRLLVAGQRPASIRLCTPDWHCTNVAQELTKNLRAQFKTAIDESANRLLVTDFQTSHLWVHPLQPDESAEPSTLQADKALNMPNDTGIDADGRVWVADSKNHRIVAFRIDEGRLREVEALSADNELTRLNRNWPMMLAFAPGGDVWVAQPDPFGKGADLLVYRPGTGARARIDLPEPGYATDVAALGSAMIVTDSENLRLYRVDSETLAVTEFGDARLREEMRQTAEKKVRYEAVTQQSLVALVVFATLMILAAVAATPKGKRFTSREVAPALAASPGPTPELKRIYWLKRDPKSERLLRWLMPMSYLMIVVTLIPIVIVSYPELMFDGKEMKPERIEKFHEMRDSLYWLVAAFLGMPIIIHFSVKTMRARLGTDGYRLYVKYPDGLQGSFAPEQLVYSGRRIAARDRLFAISLGNGKPLYVKGEIETFLGPLLARARGVSALGMFRHLLDNRETVTIASVIYSMVVAATIVYTGAWRGLLP